MTPEDINKKAYEKNPVKMSPDDDTMGFTSTDVNEAARNGYIEAYKEISALPTIKGWVARDSYEWGGRLLLYECKPRRIKEIEIWKSKKGGFELLLPNDLFPDLHWEDEPIEVELPIIRK